MAALSELPKPRMPVGFNKDDFNFSKLYKCVNFFGQNVMCDTVREMYSHHSVNSNGGIMNLQDHLISVKGWSKKDLKDKVTKLHKRFLDEDLTTTDFDISFGYVVMTEACVDLYNQLSDDCREDINKLKKIRNSICHKYGIEASELRPLVENLRDILENIYKGVGKVVKINFSEKIKSMKQDLENTLESQVRQDDFESYLEDVKMFRENKKFCMINGGRKEFESTYDKLQILNPCTWMTTEEFTKTSLSKYQIDKVFTPLKIEDRRNEIDMKEILNVTKRINGKETVPRALLMHGLAGCGKTSLCHYVVHEWCKKDDTICIDGLGEYNLVIFVEVRRARSKYLKQFMREECLKETCKTFDADDIVPTLQDIDVLFIVDGFDEAKKHVSLELVNDIFAKFGDQRIILTTRPEYHTDATYISRKFKVQFLSVQICGFDKTRLKMFSEKVFKAVVPNADDCQREIKAFHKYIDGPGSVLNEHLKLPLTVALLIYLWRDDHNIVLNVTSATRLYSEIFKLCQKRLKERLPEFQKRDDLDKVLDELLLCLGQQAWCLLLEGNLVCLTKKEVDQMKRECKKRLVDVMQLLSAYLCCETDENTDSAKRMFAFLHKTQMEYLAGTYLADAVNKRKLSFQTIHEEVTGSENSDWRNFQEVIKFWTGSFAIMGTFKKDKVEEIFLILKKAGVDNTNFNFWWSFYVETLNDRDVACKIVSDELPQENWRLDEGQVVAGLKFYHSIDVRLETLDIEIPPDVNPHAIKEFLPMMRKIREKKLMEKKKKKGQFKAVKTELHLRNHDHYCRGKTSEDFVCALSPWAWLTNFTGSLGEKEVLSYAFNLRTIRVRLDTVQAVRAFKASLSCIHKSVRMLRMTLGVPFTCAPGNLCEMEYTDKFELTLNETKDEHAAWIVGVVKQINGRNGCRRLSLVNTEISYKTISKLLMDLKHFVHEKISMDTINTPTDEEMKKLNDLQKKVHIEINWLDY